MKTIGIIGGLSPKSTVSYYKLLNDGIQKTFGGYNNAKIIVNSVNFATFVDLKEKGDWDTQATLLCNAAQSLERAGADFIILATNTMHKMADKIIKSINTPFLHIGEATAKAIENQNIKTIGLLGTKYTMELDFYKDKLLQSGIDVLIPDTEDRVEVNQIIYDELCNGIINNQSQKKYQSIIAKLQKKGAQGIIFGCTEIGLLLNQSDLPLPVFDTTQIHVQATLKKALEIQP